MRQNIQKHKSEGFTIIEVMIVLAIAGLIMLIVFLAVPALQRNARNTQMKNDASAVAGAISEFETNNNGALPAAADIAIASGVITVGSTTQNQATGKVQGTTTLATLTAKPTQASPAGLTTGSVGVRLKEDCNGTTNNRAAAVWYMTEGGNNGVQCVSV